MRFAAVVILGLAVAACGLVATPGTGILPSACGTASLLMPQVQLQLLVAGLAQPVYLTHAGDGSGRLFIVEQGGVIRIFKNGSLQTTPFLNITSRVISGGEQGLLSVAFHPNYETNGRFFVNYTAPGGGAAGQ
ncbi:MAG: PQQ-dependent sugar dehydrogenase, partial [bacterium]